MRKRWVLAAVAVGLVMLAIACDGGNGDDGSTPHEVTPGVTPPQALSTVPPPTPGQELVQFRGETIAFSYPPDWQVWSTSYESGQETIIMASVSEEEAAEGLPEGAIKIEYTGKPAEPLEPLSTEVVDRFVITGVTFTLSEGEEVPWRLRGTFKIGGVNFMYVADVQMNTDEPPMDFLRPILDSWVVGSTNHHPTRTCISPVECP